jgi:hypothetical protein
MKLIFFDEAKESPEYPHYHIGGVCIDDVCLHQVEESVSKIATDVFGKALLSKETEFHAAEIYHRKGNFKGWNDHEKRVSVLERLFVVLSRRDVMLIDIQINCETWISNDSPADLAFMFFCEKVDELMRQKRDLGMLIGDRENDRVAEKYATILSQYRASGTKLALKRDILRLVDSVHFTHSHLSRFLQLADIYTWFLQFSNRNRGSNDPRHMVLLDLLKKDEINLGPSKYKEWPKLPLW